MYWVPIRSAPPGCIGSEPTVNVTRSVARLPAASGPGRIDAQLAERVGRLVLERELAHVAVDDRRQALQREEVHVLDDGLVGAATVVEAPADHGDL